jgi:hypothetical protein
VELLLRDFAYILAYSDRAKRYGLFSRLASPIVTLGLVFYLRLSSRSLLGEISGLLAVFIYELLLISRLRGIKGFLLGLRLYAVFTVLSSLVFLASRILGMLAPNPITIPVAALRLIVLFTALSLLFQAISLGEWRTILGKLGLKTIREVYTLVLLQLPIVLYYLSESAVTIKLKYKGKRLHRIAIPLILLTAYTSRSALESRIIYGENPAENLKLSNKRDIALYLSTLLLIFLVLLLQYVI